MSCCTKQIRHQLYASIDKESHKYARRNNFSIRTFFLIKVPCSADSQEIAHISKTIQQYYDQIDNLQETMNHSQYLCVHIKVDGNSVSCNAVMGVVVISQLIRHELCINFACILHTFSTYCLDLFWWMKFFSSIFLHLTSHKRISCRKMEYSPIWTPSKILNRLFLLTPWFFRVIFACDLIFFPLYKEYKRYFSENNIWLLRNYIKN